MRRARDVTPFGHRGAGPERRKREKRWRYVALAHAVLAFVAVYLSAVKEVGDDAFGRLVAAGIVLGLVVVTLMVALPFIRHSSVPEEQEDPGEQESLTRYMEQGGKTGE